MIIYRDTKHTERLSTPPWLEGAADLHVREDVKGRLFGIGDGRAVGPASDKAWVDVGDGIQARALKGFQPLLLLRKPLWCPLHAVTDQNGTTWMAPQILSKEGAVLIQAHYGPGWVPDYTPLQAQALAIAKWSQHSHAVDAEVSAVDACRAAAELLSTVYHLTPDVISGLRLLDHGLMTVVLRRAVGYMD